MIKLLYHVKVRVRTPMFAVAPPPRGPETARVPNIKCSGLPENTGFLSFLTICFTSNYHMIDLYLPVRDKIRLPVTDGDCGI